MWKHLSVFSASENTSFRHKFRKFVPLIISIFLLRMFHHVACTIFLLRLHEKELTTLKKPSANGEKNTGIFLTQKTGKCFKIKFETFTEGNFDQLLSADIERFVEILNKTLSKMVLRVRNF